MCMVKSQKQLKRELEELKKIIELRNKRERGENPYPISDDTDLSGLPSSILTRTQREYLLGNNEPAHPRKVRNRIQSRHVMGVLDLITLSKYAQSSEKDKVASELSDGELKEAIEYLTSLRSR